MNGPLSVGFLAEPIGQALNSEFVGFKVAVGDAELRLSDRGGLELRLKRVRVADEAGNLVALAAQAAVEINTRALLRARVAPSRIDLIEPRFLLTRNESGEISVRVAAADASGAVQLDPPAGEQSRAPSVGAAQSPPQPALVPPEADADGQRRLEIGPMLVQFMSGLRRDTSSSSSYLEAFGFKDASVILDDVGNKLIWKVPRLDIGLAHNARRSVVTINASVASGGEPWTLQTTIAEDAKERVTRIETMFERLVPRRAFRGLASLDILSVLDMPLTGTVFVDLSLEGRLQRAEIRAAAAAGQIVLDALEGVSLPLEQATIAAAFDGTTQRGELESADIHWRDGRVVLKGAIAPADSVKSDAGWRFSLASSEGILGVPDPKAAPVKIERLQARGKFGAGSGGAGSGRAELEELIVRAGGAEVALKSAAGSGAGLEGRISPMPLSLLKSIWPTTVAPKIRSAVVQHVTKGALKGGHFKFAPGGPRGRDLTLTIEATDLEVETRKGLPPLEAPRALLRVDGEAFELSIPEAQIAVSANRKILFKGGRAAFVQIDGQRPAVEVSARAQGPLAAILELSERDPGSPLKGLGLPLNQIEGKTDVQIKGILPLTETATSADVRFEVKGRVTDGRIKDVLGKHDVSGATVNIDANERAVDIKGEALLAGVVARFSGQWPLAASAGADKGASPFKITARLDNADRAQLGLDLDAFLQGEMPVEITVQRGIGDDLKVRVFGDLTSAELIFDDVNWRKPVGRPGRVEFDVAKRKQTKTLELQNFKLVGENIAVEGWIALGPDNKAREYYFPDFSLNVVTNLELQGTLRPDRMWEVKARGKAFDARDLFRSFFALDGAAKPARKDKPGVELSAEIETVLGANDTTLRQVKVKATKRQQQLVALAMSGTMEGAGTVTANLRPVPGQPRTLHFDTSDAGQALKVIGFYPNMLGGKGHLALNLDARGAIETAGRLEVKRFRILGDPVVAELFSGPSDPTQPIAKGRQRVVREQFDFDRMTAEFFIGNGQVVIDSSAAEGPLIGASLRGKFDFKARQLQLGGTYVPLSGLSKPLSQVPVVREIFTGPRGEGLFGITYKIEGSMADPVVTVNPLSLLTPGFTREFMQLAPEGYQVIPRREPASRGEPQVRSSAPAEQRGTVTGPAASTGVGDAWSTSTEAPKVTRKKQPAPKPQPSPQ